MDDNDEAVPGRESLAPPPVPSLINAILAGIACAILFCFPTFGFVADIAKAAPALALFPLSLPYLSPLPLLVVGFIYGYSAAYIGAAVAMGATLIFCDASFIVAGPFALITSIPSAMLARAAYRDSVLSPNTAREEFANPGDYVMTLLYWGCVLFLTVYFTAQAYPPHAAAGTPPTFTIPVLEYFWQGMDVTLKTAPPQGIDIVQLRNVAHTLTPIIPGIIVLMWVMQMLTNLGIAAFIVHRQAIGKRILPSLLSYDIPRWVSFLFTIGLMGIFANNPVLVFFCKNAACILWFPLLLLGIAVVQYFISAQASRHHWSRGAKIAVCTAFYLSLLLSHYVIFAIILLAMLEQWLQFRRRFAIKAA